jgi:N-acetylmuramoyl-L-alanine amidase
MKIYIGVGHGQKPDGGYDPGAVSGGLVEHELAHEVVGHYASALQSGGWTVIAEHDSGTGHDPNWVGSARNANNENVDFADEVHFNAGGGTGTEVLVHPSTNQRNRRFAELACQYVSGALGLRNRGVKVRADLGFLNRTRMPAAIAEIAFVDNETDRAAIRTAGWAEKVGQALARARMEAAG